MLSIRNRQLYKNRIVLSTIAVVVGFGVTFALLKAVTPDKSSPSQSAQTSSSKRESKLIPVKASDSETGAEKSGSASEQTASTQPTTSSSALRTPSLSASSSQSSTAWKQPSTASSSQKSPATTPQQTPAQSQPATTPQPAQPEPSCTVDVLNVKVCL